MAQKIIRWCDWRGQKKKKKVSMIQCSYHYQCQKIPWSIMMQFEVCIVRTYHFLLWLTADSWVIPSVSYCALYSLFLNKSGRLEHALLLSTIQDKKIYNEIQQSCSSNSFPFLHEWPDERQMPSQAKSDKSLSDVSLDGIVVKSVHDNVEFILFCCCSSSSSSFLNIFIQYL